MRTRLELRIRNIKDQLDYAVELAQDNFVSNLNVITRKMFMSQITEQKNFPKGRRFSLDDKVLALSIMKQSNKGYE